MKNKKIKKYGRYVVGIGALIIVFFYVFGGSSYTFYNDPIICTTDVKQCPDGSWVGRVAPSCEFDLCPVTNTCSDGTLFNQCSVTKPLYCDNNGTLYANASVCGCQEGTFISGDICKTGSEWGIVGIILAIINWIKSLFGL